MSRRRRRKHGAPKILDRYDLPHGTIFVVTCCAGFDREAGQRIAAHGSIWEILGWDDHRMATSPSDGENIAFKVREIPG